MSKRNPAFTDSELELLDAEFHASLSVGAQDLAFQSIYNKVHAALIYRRSHSADTNGDGKHE